MGYSRYIGCSPADPNSRVYLARMGVLAADGLGFMRRSEGRGGLHLLSELGTKLLILP